MQEAASSSIGNAEDAAARLGPEAASRLLAAGDAAFDSGARAGLLAAAAALALASAFAAIAMKSDGE